MSPRRVLGTTPLIAILLTWTAGTVVLAQWVDDPSINTPIEIGPGEAVQAKWAVRADGSAYISWLQNDGGGFDVYLQRLDATGAALWTPALRVAERGYGSTTDYGLSLDSFGHALLAFRDDRLGGDRITAVRVDPDGSFDWGPGGTSFGNGSGFVASPQIAGLSDGNSLLAWFVDGRVEVVSLGPTGATRWSDSIVDANGIAVSDLHASDAPGESGQAILMLATLASPAIPRVLSAVKYDASGNRLWGAAPAVFSTGSLQLGNFPGFTPDGSGGLVASWYQSQPALQVYLQHLDADGMPLLASSGVTVSSNTARLRSNPALAFDPAGPDYYVFWRETDSLQAPLGLWGQAFDALGTRQWGGEGLELLPIGGAFDIGGITAARIQNEPVVTAETDGTLRAARFDRAGAAVWSPGWVPVSTATGDVSRVRIAASRNAPALYLAWEDGRTGGGDLYAQRLAGDGTLGGLRETIFGDGFEPDGD